MVLDSPLNNDLLPADLPALILPVEPMFNAKYNADDDPDADGIQVKCTRTNHQTSK
jgi:hypothetical protein